MPMSMPVIETYMSPTRTNHARTTVVQVFNFIICQYLVGSDQIIVR